MQTELNSKYKSSSPALKDEDATKVARWKDDFKIDGIDLDLEEGAGSRKEAGPNMVHFVRWEKEENCENGSRKLSTNKKYIFSAGD